MTTKEQFISDVKKLDAKDGSVKKNYEEHEKKNEKNIIRDGVVNAEKYFDSKIKILWILKEPYDIDNEGEYDWSISELLGDENCLTKLGGATTTWHPIIYTTYGILNNFMLYDDMEFIKNDNSMVNILKEIAFINVQKFPAKTITNDSDIKNAYKEHSAILLEQIKTYNPDIIIGGNTLKYFIDDLGLNDTHKKYDEFDYWIKENKLYIDARHPAFRGVKEDYIDDIVRVAKKFYDNKNAK